MRVVVVTHGTNNIWTQGLDRQEPIVVGGSALSSKKGIYIDKVMELAKSLRLTDTNDKTFDDPSTNPLALETPNPYLVRGIVYVVGLTARPI